MPSRRSRRTVAVAIACLSGLGLAATAARAADAPLADHVPADALFYVGWTGADACPGYAGSHLAAVVGHSDMPQMFATFVPQVVRRVAKRDEHAGQVFDQLVSTAGPMWHHPTAFYFGGVDFPSGQAPVFNGRRGRGPMPKPRLALVCDAGSDAADLVQQVNGLLQQLPPDARPLPTVTQTGTLVVIAYGAFDPAGHPLSGDPAFAAALAQCKPAGATLVAYGDLHKAVATIDTAIAHADDPDVGQKWPQIRDALGLAGFHSVAVTGGFEGKDWVEHEYATTDGKHVGLEALLDGKPLDATLLAVVPRSADRVGAARFDIAALYDAVHDGLSRLDAEVAQQVDQQVAQVNRMAGLDVRRDLIGSIGDQWATYTDRTVGGTGLTGTVVLNKLRDPAKAEVAMRQVALRLNLLIARQLLPQRNVEIQFREQTVNGTALHYLAVPIVSPTWAIKDGYLYVGLYPQVVASAIDAAAAAKGSGGSILAKPQFVATMQKLGGHPAASLSFTDLPAVAPDAYADLLGQTRLLLGIADIVGAHPPVLVVPPLKQILPELEPSGSVTWSDAAGWHGLTMTPFPGADSLGAGGGGGGSLVQQMMMFGAMGQMMDQFGH